MIGIDLVSLDHLEQVMSEPFKHRAFTPDELAYAEGRPQPLVHLATTFAAKEAVIKALGLDLRAYPAVEIHRDTGIPSVVWSTEVEAPTRDVFVSLAADGDYAIAIALASLGDDTE